MALKIDIRFGSFKEIGKNFGKGAGSAKGGARAASAGTLAVFAGKDVVLSQQTQTALGKAAVSQVARAAASAKFKGAANACLEILAPEDLAFDRLLVVGTHRKAPADNKPDIGPHDARLGGALMAKLSAPGKAQVLLDPPDGASAETAATLLLGLRLRGYKFDLYKTKKKDDENGDNGDNGAAKKSAAKKPDEALDILVAVADPAAARRAAAAQEAIAAGVIAARDLVNEPANILTPMEFAKRAAELKKLGVVIEILDERKMQRLGMNTLLGVAQGSRNPPRLVIMRWNGGGRAKPIAFIGKGVTFDTGGISIKPAGSMEDMKGDMAGAACVTGLMRTLAMRKAKANVIGAIGLVENMPDGNAQRPGDIVKSMSGQTVEIINTDAEGRLVLADVLWHIQDKYKPQFMINLATLTGAILVSLGNEYAGLFSNNDELSERLSKLGMTTGEKVWRMPMGPAYDKMLDSKFADMKNVGGRLAGSITAAQFLQRFVNKTPWVHLDVAGTAMSSPSDEINQSWGSGWGVRLLNALVAEHYEK